MWFINFDDRDVVLLGLLSTSHGHMAVNTTTPIIMLCVTHKWLPCFVSGWLRMVNTAFNARNCHLGDNDLSKLLPLNWRLGLAIRMVSKKIGYITTCLAQLHPISQLAISSLKTKFNSAWMCILMDISRSQTETSNFSSVSLNPYMIPHDVSIGCRGSSKRGWVWLVGLYMSVNRN